MPTPKLTAATLLLLCTALFAQQKGTLTDTRDGKIYKADGIFYIAMYAKPASYR
jgi:hypothetical protein